MLQVALRACAPRTEQVALASVEDPTVVRRTPGPCRLRESFRWDVFWPVRLSVGAIRALRVALLRLHVRTGALFLMTSPTDTSVSTTPPVAVNDIGDAAAFLAAIDETIKYFNDGDIVEGVIVKVDRDEVLLDIGYKTEGVIPSRELSIKHDVD